MKPRLPRFSSLSDLRDSMVRDRSLGLLRVSVLSALFVGGTVFGQSSGSVWSNDADGDGLTDGHELSLGLNPDHADADGDGFDDLQEITLRTNPMDGLSRPAATPSPSSLAFLYKSSDTTFRTGWFFFEPSGRRPDLVRNPVFFYYNDWFKPRERGIRGQEYERAHVSSVSSQAFVVYEIGVELPLTLFQSRRQDDIGWHVYLSLQWGNQFLHAGHNVRLVAGELAVTFWIPGFVQGPNGGTLPLPRATFRPIDAPSAATTWTRDNACYMELDPNQIILQPELVLSWYPVARAGCEPAPGWMCPTNRCNSGAWSLSHKEWLRFVDPFAVGF